MERTTSEIAGIKAFDEQSIIALMKDLGQPAFRAKQLIQWIYAKGAHSYDEMTNLPAALRDELAARYPLFVPELEERLVSKDGSRKYLVRFADGTSVETVGIPSNHRLTVPACALLGANLLLLCDCLVSLASYSMSLSLPISTLSSLIAAPIIIYVILKL